MAVPLRSEPSPVTLPFKEVKSLELSVVMPCLNEAETIESCVRKSLQVLEEANIAGEVIVADNGSTDGSLEIAEQLLLDPALPASKPAFRDIHVVLRQRPALFNFHKRLLGRFQKRRRATARARGSDGQHAHGRPGALAGSLFALNRYVHGMVSWLRRHGGQDRHRLAPARKQ